MGGSKQKDYIENLQALCRECHLKYGDKKQYKEFLEEIHLKKLQE
jgi:5-methylcytosine-specific restriction endonuclease McrA